MACDNLKLNLSLFKSSLKREKRKLVISGSENELAYKKKTTHKPLAVFRALPQLWIYLKIAQI